MNSAPESPAIAPPGPTRNAAQNPSSRTGQDSPPEPPPEPQAVTQDLERRLAAIAHRQQEISRQRTSEEPTRLAGSSLSNSLPPSTGRSPEAEAEFQRGLERARASSLEAQRRQRLLAAHLPERHVAEAPVLAASAIGAWAEAYADLLSRIEEGWMHALIGPRGGGKTQLAVCLAMAFLRRDLSVRYWRAMDFFRECRSCFGDKDRSESEFIDAQCRIGLLILDEAHERGQTDYEDRTLGNVLDRRYGRRSPTLLISNATVEEFTQQVGLSVVDRMIQTGGIIVCDWSSFRSAKS